MGPDQLSLQSKMRLLVLLLVRASALALLSLLPVAMATARQGLACRQEVTSELIRELWRRHSQLIRELPREEGFSRRLRLLPKFCTKCPERAIGWLELQQMIDIYQRSVFSRDAIQRLLPLHYNDLLYRLQHTLHHCVSMSKPSKWNKAIKKFERKIKKKKSEDVALKAVGELTFILRWIDELAQLHVL